MAYRVGFVASAFPFQSASLIKVVLSTVGTPTKLQDAIPRKTPSRLLFHAASPSQVPGLGPKRDRRTRNPALPDTPGQPFLSLELSPRLKDG